MYSLTLTLHSWLRWIVLLLAITATVRGLRGYVRPRAWADTDRRINMLTTIAFDIQFLLGLALYLFLSPFTTAAFHDFRDAIRTSGVRYWAVEHIAIMVLALIVAHVGNVMTRRAASSQAQHFRTAIFFGGALLLLLIGMPWPGLPNGRPLFRFGG